MWSMSRIKTQTLCSSLKRPGLFANSSTDIVSVASWRTSTLLFPFNSIVGTISCSSRRFPGTATAIPANFPATPSSVHMRRRVDGNIYFKLFPFLLL